MNTKSIFRIPPVEKRPLSAAALKYIAAAIMVIDHSAVALLLYPIIKPAEPVIVGSGIWKIYRVYQVMRGIGRISFPIFCFFIVEGFLYTHSKLRYALRMLVFGLISEIPFDLALRGSLMKWDHQNVMFEFLFAIIMLALWDKCEHMKDRSGQKIADADIHSESDRNGLSGKAVSSARRPETPDPPDGKSSRVRIAAFTVLQCASAALLMYLAEICRLDYGWKGLGLILLIYLLRFSRNLQCVLGALVMSLWEPPAILSFIPLIYLYSGKRGRRSKWFFYAFYPGHLMILYLLSLLIA